MDTLSSPNLKLANALEEYEARMGLEALTIMIAQALLACSARTTNANFVEYPIETDFVSGTILVKLN
jgi:hypothetical protein